MIGRAFITGFASLFAIGWVLRPVGCHRTLDEIVAPEVELAEDAVPRAPQPVSPKYGRVFSNVDQVTLRWKVVSAAKGYSLEVAGDSLFRSSAFQARADTTFVRTSSLPERKYYWRVQALNSKGVGGTWSETWIFTLRSGGPVDDPQ